jgi:hypothetical protein
MAVRKSFVFVLLSSFLSTRAFQPLSTAPSRARAFDPSSPVVVFASGDAGAVAEEVDDSKVQWELFKRHHAKGSWKGIWTTYDYIGDAQMETVASVNLEEIGDDTIQLSHTIAVGATRSDCATCFDSMETKDIPVATYTPNDLKQARFGACGMVNGPTLLRNGASKYSTERTG